MQSMQFHQQVYTSNHCMQMVVAMCARHAAAANLHSSVPAADRAQHTQALSGSLHITATDAHQQLSNEVQVQLHAPSGTRWSASEQQQQQRPYEKHGRHSAPGCNKHTRHKQTHRWGCVVTQQLPNHRGQHKHHRTDCT